MAPRWKTMHVTHAAVALRIIEDGWIANGLIRDQSNLNRFRTTVAWLSPNYWANGSRYGNVEFSFAFDKLASGRSLYWVEAMTKYSPHAPRFLLTDQAVGHLPVQPYDPSIDNGPLRFVAGKWWRNAQITLEIMVEEALSLSECRKLDFVQHHPVYCAIGNRCKENGTYGTDAAGRVIAAILSRRIRILDDVLRSDDGRDISRPVNQGVSNIVLKLGALHEGLSGPLASTDEVDTVLRAALLQLSMGDQVAAKASAALICDARTLRQALKRLCEEHLMITSEMLADLD